MFISFWFPLLFLFSLFHSFFTSPSPCFSFFFFLYLIFPYLFFLHRRFCESSFCFTSFLFSLSFVLDLIFLFILLLYLFFEHLRIFFLPEKNSKISVVNLIFLHEIMSLFFEPSLLRCFISCFFPPWVVLIPCLFHVVLIISASWHYFSWFSFINLLFGSLKNKLSFCCWTKVSKNIIDTLFIIKKKICFSWLSSIFAFEFVFSRMIFKNILLFFFVFTFFFEGYLGSFVLISLFLFKKKITFKKSDSLNFSLVFLLTLFSLFCFVSLCLLSLLLVFSLHAFSLFFSSFFLFPCFLSLGLPLAMFIYSLSCASSVDSFFFLKIHFYLFFFFFSKKKKTSFFICSSLFL